MPFFSHLMKNSAPILSVSGSAISKKVSSSHSGSRPMPTCVVYFTSPRLTVTQQRGLDVVKLRVELLDVARGDVNAASGVRIFSYQVSVDREGGFTGETVSNARGFSVDRFSRPEADRRAELRACDATVRRDAARSKARPGSRRGRAGRARARRRGRGETARARARIARSRAAARARAPRRIRWRRKAHSSPRRERARGEATLGGADRAAPVTRIGRAGDAPELRHGERSVCAETTVCAFARGRRTARRPLITCRTIDGLRCLVDKDTGDSEKTRV